MVRFIGVLLIGLLTACGNIVVSETEEKAAQSVLEFYGGTCQQSKGVTSTDGVTNTYFELEMSNSALLDSYASMLEMPASNIAFLFFSNLKDDRTKYTQIKVKINLTTGESYENTYSTKDLVEVESLIPILAEVSDKIKAHDYEGFRALFVQEEETNVSAEQLQSHCAPLDSAYGNIDQTQFQGYAFFESEQDERALVHLAGIQIREKENTPISLYIDRKSKGITTFKNKF